MDYQTASLAITMNDLFRIAWLKYWLHDQGTTRGHAIC